MRRILLAGSLLLGASGAAAMLDGRTAGMAALLLGSLGVGFWLLLWGDEQMDEEDR